MPELIRTEDDFEAFFESRFDEPEPKKHEVFNVIGEPFMSGVGGALESISSSAGPSQATSFTDVTQSTGAMNINTGGSTSGNVWPVVILAVAFVGYVLLANRK